MLTTHMRAARCIVILLLLPAVASALDPGQAYDLELRDGSTLRRAVFRGHEPDGDLFEVASVSGLLRITDYRVIPRTPSHRYMLAVAAGGMRPQNQGQLGFEYGLALQASGAFVLFPGSDPWIPHLVVAAGFARYSGTKALLAGPEVAMGPGWIFPLSQGGVHNLNIAATIGSGFYQLLNQSLDQTYRQTTLCAGLQVGYTYRMGTWGLSLAYAQQYIYDQNLPLFAGGLRAAVTHFGGGA